VGDRAGQTEGEASQRQAQGEGEGQGQGSSRKEGRRCEERQAPEQTCFGVRASQVGRSFRTRQEIRQGEFAVTRLMLPCASR
jgi:hypothetical protein